MHKQHVIMLVLAVILCACGENAVEKEGLGPGELNKWNDTNFEVMSVGAYNYTDHDIYDIFILPPDKTDIKFAAIAGGHRATPHGAERWGFGGGGANLAWDYRWATPVKFKVLWLRVVDLKSFNASGSKYDKYTMKATQPGGAWCEGELSIEHSPDRDRGGDLIIHYYPDGHIEGDVVHIDGDVSRVEIKYRDSLPALSGRACLKEISNPYFGKKKPIAMN